MASTGLGFKLSVLRYIPNRGLVSDDWSDPDDFKGTDTIKYYCDADAANDSGNGLTDSTPKKLTVSVMALLRTEQASNPNTPHQVLFKRGTTANYGPIENLRVTLGSTSEGLYGRSSTQRLVFGTYGVGERAVFDCGGFVGVTGNTNHSSLTNKGNKNLAFLGLKFTNIGSVSAGMYFPGNLDNLLIEDCEFDGGFFSIQFFFDGVTTHKNVVFRRSVFHDATSNFVRLIATDGIVFEECIFDNLILTSNTGNLFSGIQARAIECWNGAKNIEVNNCLFLNYGNRGIWAASGLIAHDNIFVGGVCGIQVGNAYGAAEANYAADPAHVRLCSIVGNYIGEGKDLVPGSGTTVAGSFGIWLQNIFDDGTGRPIVSNNIITKNAGTGTLQYAIYVKGSGDNGAGVSAFVSGLTVSGNKVYKWRSGAGNLIGLALASTNSGLGNDDIFDVDYLGNDVQEPTATAGYLVRIFDQSLIPQFQSGIGRFWRGGPTTDRFNYGAGGTDFANWVSAVGDATSQEVQVPYPDPDKTIGDYHGTLGGTATLTAFRAAAVAMARYDAAGANAWDDRLMPELALGYFRANFDA